MLPAPKIDKRTAPYIIEQLHILFKEFTPDEKRIDPNRGVEAALIGIFSRFAELIIERLNQVPEKNFLAFLDLLGASLLPPQPARVPLTFSLAAGSAIDGLVPAGTQVAAAPAEGEKAAIIFETERELAVTAAQLISIFARNPETDRYADHSAIINSTSTQSVPIFLGDRYIEHILYIGHETLLDYSGLQEVRLTFNMDERINDPDPFLVEWEIWDGTSWIPKEPLADYTSQQIDSKSSAPLTQSGVIFFNNISKLPQQIIGGLTRGWMRCRLLTPITPAVEKQAAIVRANRLPKIANIRMGITSGGTNLAVERAFFNTIPVDTGKEFFPFGEKPKFGDTLYLAIKEAFSEAPSKITLHITLTNPTGDISSPIPPTGASGNLRLLWEFWDGKMWIELGTSGVNGSLTAGFRDTTNAFTSSGRIDLTLFKQPVAAVVNGAESFWIRVRIISGNYGQEARYELLVQGHPEEGYKLIPATYAPPSIRSIAVDYSLTKEAGAEEVTVLAYNDFVYENQTDKKFEPFQPTKDTRPSLYLGFTLPAGRKSFPNRKISIFAGLDQYRYGETLSGNVVTSSKHPQLAWEYSTKTGWSNLPVLDQSVSFTQSGLIEFLAPSDFADRGEFGLTRYWLRSIWKSGEYSFDPRLRRLLPNTTMASQSVTIKNEILGSSDASKNQKFRTTRTPILEGQRLEVREPEMPSAIEQEKIRKEEGEDAISVISNGTSRPKEIWVRWKQVPDFYGSEARDRHYVIDNITGDIRFGDGLNGLIPPAGTGNIRMAIYRTGGSSAGNRPAGTIVQLKTTVPYVEKVTNYDAATGGANAETLDSLLKRAPRLIRHRGRAVTIEDFEDLAMLASPEVARARCIPLCNLAIDPGATKIIPGTISLIIVPSSTDPKPLPSFELIRRVRKFIDNRRTPAAELIVVGPEYIRIDVEVELTLTSLEGSSKAELIVTQTLSRFLHPLTGGLEGTGWDFGRKPHKSDLYALIEAIPYVDHVRSLKVTMIDDRTGTITEMEESVEFDKADRFMVYSGTHKISLSL